ncbi:uncharacterized protein LOC110615491 isoform X1 [Manihot esculenta]|nr:uncharacterized protein LOC110615491 isoform X1 [Manihot esculenta]KAG8654190.1 hypothetical protein MANES_05G107500v8 [Manihot esculenta]
MLATFLHLLPGMGTKVHCESCFPGYFSMRDLNEDSNSCSWPLYYGDRAFTNGQYYNGFLPRTITDVYPGYDKDVVKQTMLEHEAIFKTQLCELHRLYRIQRDLMDESKRKELYKNRMPIETSLSSSPLASQITSEDARRWHIPGFPLGNSVCGGPSTSCTEDMHSPLSSIKGSSAQASPLLSQNGGTPKDMEILDSRPTKVRRKMFDLQLPADEYLDTEGEQVQLRDENVCGISNYLSNRNHNVATATSGKTNCQGDAFQSESCLKSKNNLADLNEPIDVEDTNGSANDLLGCTSSHCEIQEHELATKPKSQFLGFPKEVLLNHHHGSNNGIASDLYLQNNVKGKLWFPHMLDSGNSNNNIKSPSQSLQPEKLPSSSQPLQVLSNKNNEPATLFHTDQSKVDQLRERTSCGSELSGRNNEVSNNNLPVSDVASHIPSQYAIDPSSDLSNCWSWSGSSRDKLGGSLSQKSMSVQMHLNLNSSATLSRSSQSSTQSHGVFGDQWNYNSSSASNLRVGTEMPDQNGFYHGSSSGSKDLLIRFPPGNRDFLNYNSASDAAQELIHHGLEKLYKSSNCVLSKSAQDVNLNAALSNSSSTKMTSQKGLEVIDLERNHEDHHVALPWLRTKPDREAEAVSAGVDLNMGGFSDLQSSLKQLSDKREAGRIPNQTVVQNMKSAPCSNVFEASRIEARDSSSCRRILGFPIFEKPDVSKIESSSLPSPSVLHPQPSQEVENNRKIRALDINLPCDPAVPDCFQQTVAEVLTEKEKDTQVANVRYEIDLNSCITEDESSLVPSAAGANVRMISGIDLEAPAVPETEEEIIPGEECLAKAHAAPSELAQHKTESPPDEFVRIAAEAIVAISVTGHNHQVDATHNPSEASMTDSLHWFVEIVSSFGEDLESKFAVLEAEGDSRDKEGPSLEDYFESMTLKLTETKEEDYMPKPLVPEDLKLEETGRTLLPTRTRRGQSRRGRQRRDFQRDILPGLVSLSRHEVTEDLQTFGGLMRASGHIWNSGLTRRSGCGRGRRRALASSSPPAVIASEPCTPLIQQLNNVEVRLDDRSLTGWGKTPRRPRRQRCPPGNAAALPLS